MKFLTMILVVALILQVIIRLRLQVISDYMLQNKQTFPGPKGAYYRDILC